MTPAARTAVALNNLAVRFSERGYDKDAFETFRDAVAAVQVACQQQGWYLACSDSRNYDQLIRKPAQRLAQTLLPSSRPTSTVKFSTLSDISDYLAVEEDISRLVDQQPAFCGEMIRIEGYGNSDHSSTMYCDMDAAIILHNYGLSCLSLSLSTPDKGKSAKFRRSAIKLVRWSQSLSVSYIYQAEEFTYNEIDERAFLITLTATKSIAQTLQLATQGRPGYVTGALDVSLQHIEQVKRAALEHGFFYWGIMQKRASPASAA